MSRSILRLREQSHTVRTAEPVVEVCRDGVVVATIYGSREGLHIASVRQPYNGAFSIEGPTFSMPGWSVTLLEKEEACPWCGGSRQLTEGLDCPVCKVRERANGTAAL